MPNFLFRPKKISLDDSMKEVIEFQDLDELVEHIEKMLVEFPEHGLEISVMAVKEEWGEHVVVVRQNFNNIPNFPNINYMVLNTVIGFTNGLVIDEKKKTIKVRKLKVKKSEPLFDYTMTPNFVERVQ